MQLIQEIILIVALIIAVIVVLKILNGLFKISIFILALALILFSSWYAFSSAEDKDMVAFAVKKIGFVQDYLQSKYSEKISEAKNELINTAKDEIKETFKSELNSTISEIKKGG